jgi:hypothetical protein
MKICCSSIWTNAIAWPTTVRIRRTWNFQTGRRRRDDRPQIENAERNRNAYRTFGTWQNKTGRPWTSERPEPTTTRVLLFFRDSLSKCNRRNAQDYRFYAAIYVPV